MEKKQAVIFDMDGVLLDTEPVSKQAFKQAFEAEKMSLDEQTYQEILGRSLTDISVYLSEKYQDPLIGKKIIKERDQFFLEYYQQHKVDVLAGVVSFLEYLKHREIKTAVATSSHQKTAEYLLKQADIYHYFDAFSYGSEVKEAKPNPEIFLNAAKKIQAEPKNAYVVEDAEAGILGAVAGGFTPIYISETSASQSTEAPCDCLTFRNMEEFHLHFIESRFQTAHLST